MENTVTETTVNSDAVNSAIKLRTLTEEAFTVAKQLKVLNVKIESLLNSIKVPDSSAPALRELVCNSFLMQRLMPTFSLTSFIQFLMVSQILSPLF